MGRLSNEESDRRISQIAQWITAGEPKRACMAKIRETFKLGNRGAPRWYRLTLQALAKDAPDLADLRVEAVEKARELYRRAYAEGDLTEANRALALLSRLTGIEEGSGDKATEVVVRFARAEGEAPAKPPEA